VFVLVATLVAQEDKLKKQITEIDIKKVLIVILFRGLTKLIYYETTKI